MGEQRWCSMGLLCLLACGADEHHASGSEPDAAMIDGPDAPRISVPIDAGAGPIVPVAPAAPVPTDFVQAEFGGYRLGAPLARDAAAASQSSSGSDPAACAVMLGVVRDFRGASEPNGHPDFETFDGKKPTPGLVADSLGADHKPVYASKCEAVQDKTLCPYGPMTTSRARFDEWYRSVDTVNLAYLVYLAFEANGSVYTFESKSFFPLDGEGFGNAGGKKKHNFGFSTELHTTFRYRGGERFGFTGDDDLWVFINGKLAIDLGGLHPPASAQIDLDAIAAKLGITPGASYALDLFHAERHSASSNFRVDTTIEFTDCGRVTAELL